MRRYLETAPLLPDREDRDGGRQSQEDLERIYRGYLESPRKRRSWAADNPGNVAIRTELASAVLAHADRCLHAPGAVLDVGCGTGWALGALAAHGVDATRLHGIDLIPARIEAARRRLPAADVRLADARDLPYGNAEFTLVLMLLCLSSMPGPEAVRAALREARRVLTPGGILLCYEPRVGNPFNRATIRVSRAVLRSALGKEDSSLTLTGFPPLARRLGRLTPRLYPSLARLAPSHRLAVYRG